MILAVDPGNAQSALVKFDGHRVSDRVTLPNAAALEYLQQEQYGCDHMAIEMIASYGMAVGREVFETCLWIGRFIQAWHAGLRHTLVYRQEVKLHLCGVARAKDANIRAALIDLFGGKERAIGNKKSPGPLYGVVADEWAALAVAVTHLKIREIETLRQ